MNYMLGFTIYLSPNAVMTAGPSSHKSKFIYYFKIAHYWEKLIFNKKFIEKLWCWRPKGKSNYVQLAIFLPFYSRLYQ